MQTCIRRGIRVFLLAGGILVLGAGAATAAEPGEEVQGGITAPLGLRPVEWCSSPLLSVA